MTIVITISGLHGTGKSTYARIISKNFRLKHVSAGGLFRTIAKERGLSVAELSKISSQNQEIDAIIDERTKQAAQQGNVILDGLLAGWIAYDLADLRVFLTATNDIRFRRIARREGISYNTARRTTLFREQLERRRFKQYYGIDIDDITIYDLILNTSLLHVRANIDIIELFIKEYLKIRGRRIVRNTDR